MISELLRLPTGVVDLSSIDTDAKPGFEGGKKDGAAALPALRDELVDLQEKLFAEAYVNDVNPTGARRILLVLQGMDTSGKGGVLSHAVGLLNPSGVKLKSFKKPTAEELAHDFLWRVERELPTGGEIGIFDRSHYEDVLVAKVHGLADAAEIERRYGAINAFEAWLVETGTTVVKCMLHISPEEQKKRLLARLDEPTKQWKFKPEDVDERGHWAAYQEAYRMMLERCSTDAAPWHVIPSDRKWYRNWAVGNLLLETLRGMDLAWPGPDYDVAEQRARLENEVAP